jgi:hypothetical protein
VILIYNYGYPASTAVERSAYDASPAVNPHIVFRSYDGRRKRDREIDRRSYRHAAVKFK